MTAPPITRSRRDTFLRYAALLERDRKLLPSGTEMLGYALAYEAALTAAEAEVARLKEALDVRELFINPHLLEKYADEIDCCPGCDNVVTEPDVNFSMCHAEDRGDYCPNNLAETLRAVAKVARQTLTGETP